MCLASDNELQLALTPQQEHTLNFYLSQQPAKVCIGQSHDGSLRVSCLGCVGQPGGGEVSGYGFGHCRLPSCIKITQPHTLHHPTQHTAHSPRKHDKTCPVRAGPFPGDGQRLHAHPSQPAAILYAPTTIITPPCFFFLLLPYCHGGRGSGRCRARTARWCPGGFGGVGLAGCSCRYVE